MDTPLAHDQTIEVKIAIDLLEEADEVALEAGVTTQELILLAVQEAVHKRHCRLLM